MVNLPSPNLVSCDARRLYDEHSFPGMVEELSEIASRPPGGQYVCDLFPSYSYERPFDIRRFHGDHDFISLIEQGRRAINHGKTGSTSALFHLRDVVVRDRVIYIKNGSGSFDVLYETFRPIDRESSGLGSSDEINNAIEIELGDDPVLFLQSTGCFNYGHWVADDLSRLSAFWKLRRLHPHERIIVLISAHGGEIDQVRQASVKLLLASDNNFTILLIPRPGSFAFRNIYYVAPTTYFGVLKSPAAMATLQIAAINGLMQSESGAAQQYLSTRGGANGKRLFIDRGLERSRGLKNGGEILKILISFGFEHYTLEGLSFAKQVELFSQASFVIGNMGAGMVNTVFCPPGTDIFYLIPSGWDDPFFWDLASVMGHQHHAYYGPIIGSTIFDGFTVDPIALESLIKDIIANKT